MFIFTTFGDCDYDSLPDLVWYCPRFVFVDESFIAKIFTSVHSTLKCHMSLSLILVITIYLAMKHSEKCDVLLVCSQCLFEESSFGFSFPRDFNSKV